MHPVLKYTLARLGIFAVVAAVLVALPVGVNLYLRLAIAVVISAAVSWFALAGMRNAVANQLATAVNQRADRREKLRSALAGEDEPPSQPPA